MKKILLFLFLATTGVSVKAQLSESFDGAIFPPAGWLNLHSLGLDPTALWEGTTSAPLGLGVTIVNPHSGTGMAIFRAYDFPAGNGAHLITSAVDLSAGSPHHVSFWMYRDDAFDTWDSISVYVNATPTITGATFLGKVLRKKSYAPVETGPDGWYKYSFNVPPSFNTSVNHFLFSAYSDYGNNLFLDDIAVETQPACGAPTDITTTNFNYAAGTIDISWSTPSTGSPIGYEWAMTTMATPPSTGTAVTGTTTTISGITKDVVNYIYMRSDCGSGTFSNWEYYALASLPCAAIIDPVDNATDVTRDQSFTWNAVPGASSYDFYLGTAQGAEALAGNTVSTDAVIPNLIPGQLYYWYIVPVINGVAAPSACTISSFTIKAEPLTPPNNPCSGAINIGSSNNDSNPIAGTTVGATLTIPESDCLGTTASPDDDVWFEFTTSGSTVGTITITPAATGGIKDIVAQVYEATSCTSLGTPVTCADATLNQDKEIINISTLQPNTHYFMRVFSSSNLAADQGAFTVAASLDNTLPIALSSFTARPSGEVNILNWSTSQEFATRYFAIERSTNGANFTEIGRVSAAGNSGNQRSYQFVDDNPTKGLNYYRLRIVDIDNTSKYSMVKNVKNLRLGNLAVYPNPVRTMLQLHIEAERTGKAMVNIRDINGRSVHISQLQLLQGSNNVPIDVTRFAKGTYFIKIQMTGESIIRKFTKQ